MKKLFLISCLLIATGFSQSVSHYYDQYGFLAAPPLAFQNGLVGHVNPAAGAYLRHFESRFYYQDEIEKGQKKNWGIFTGAQGLAFGMHQQYAQDFRITDYSISSASVSGAFAYGSAYHWSTGDQSEFGRQRTLAIGSAWRPNHFFSLGLTGFYGFKDYQKEALVEFGFRPLGTPALTVFGDCVVDENLGWNDEWWSAGAAVNVGPGISVVGRYFGSEMMTVGLVLDLGNLSVGDVQHFDAGQKKLTTTHQIRLGDMRKSFVQTKLTKELMYTPFVLDGRLKYQRYQFFDASSLLFSDLLTDLKAAADDPRTKALVLNMNRLSISAEHAWEVREMLKYAQDNGKVVIAFIERPMMAQYHLASVADYIVLDPMGTVLLPGYLMNPTFLSGTLKKVGLGYDEWRLFKYKSANERFSRDQMSDADREQRQAFLDDVYELVRTDISKSRRVSESTVDEWIDNKTVIMANDALESGLVDTLARWKDREKIVQKLADRKLLKLDRSLLWEKTVEKRDWGPDKYIAVVYGIGGTMMDSGMNARSLERTLLKLTRNKQVKAVVFRVDSPGGDAMAADVVAEAVRACAKEKPVIISQGGVAASGGYWVSMYGDEIFAGPSSVTGSIGVIGGWMWDDGFSDKLGMTYDYVKRGKHADVLAGVSIPLLGRIPARNMTDEEHELVEKLIKDMYEEFVAKVANGRSMEKDAVHEIAQGRIWSGVDGLDNKLVDQIGGLAAAMEYAKSVAGLADEQVQYIHVGIKLGLFEMLGGGIKTKIYNDPVLDYIRLFSQSPLQPAAIVPSGSNPYFLNE